MAEDMEMFAGRLRVLELYSGIGGMHWALKESGVEYDVVQAMDVNTTANKIYQHNFPDVSICASTIAKLTLNQMVKWAPNTILMSPPCQPFTRVGKKQDCQDPRTQSFLHLLDLLRKLEHKPEYILVENVKGFEVSETRKLLVDMLNDCNYAFQEFLLTPLQFGVPNCRMRYYLVAKLKPLEFAFRTSDKVLQTVPRLPAEAIEWLRYRKPQHALSLRSLHRNCRKCSGFRRSLKSPCSGPRTNLKSPCSDFPVNWKSQCDSPVNFKSCVDSPVNLKSPCSDSPANFKSPSSDSPVNFKSQQCSNSPVNLQSPFSDSPVNLKLPCLDSPANVKALCSDSPANFKSLCLDSPVNLKSSCSDSLATSELSGSGTLANLKSPCSDSPANLQMSCSDSVTNTDSSCSFSPANLKSSLSDCTQGQAAGHGHVSALHSDSAAGGQQASSECGLSSPAAASKCTCRTNNCASHEETREKFTGDNNCECQHSRLKMLKTHSTEAVNLLDQNTSTLCANVLDCADEDKLLTDGGRKTDSLTIAEAGRNMRHCEEEDVLVCEDGTRLEEYLEKADDAYFDQFLLDDKELRMFVVMDVVHPSFRKSSCFTKRYGHYIEGAGSLIMMTDDVQVVKEASEFKSWAVEHKNRQQWGEAELAVLRRLKLRYFTPREVANLLCFPPEFEFPEEFNTIQCHRVLGNSLNVHVVSILIRLLLMEPGVI